MWLLCLCLCGAFPALAAPSVHNVSFAQPLETRLVSVIYDLSGGTLQRVAAGVRQQRATYDMPVNLLLAKPEFQQVQMTSATYG